MQSHLTGNVPVRPLSDKPCLVCGNFIPAHKPHRLKRAKVCSRDCQKAYQVGEKNPNWRGGLVAKTCPRCSKEFKERPARASTRVYCSYACQHRRRPRETANPKPAPPPRLCKACGQVGVKKGRAYHPACRPLPANPRRALACPDCGVVRLGCLRAGGMTPYCQPCSFKRRRGSGNSNWQGGITSENGRLRSTEQYKRWRAAVYERDAYTCVWCGQRGGNLHADHIKPFCAFPDLRFIVANGRTLCVACHEKTDTYMSKARKFQRRSGS